MNNNSRLKNSIRNVSVGLIVTVINTLVSFVTRTVLIKTLGLEVLGLNGLFTEVISMLSLAEMGVGMAIIYSLYKPISENDEKKISQLMGLYRKAYNTIALVTFALGLLLMPFIDKLITDIDYPLPYIRLIFMLFVLKTSTTYLFSYKTSLLNADQKQYLVSMTTAIVKVVMTVVLVIELFVFKNYVVFLLLSIAQSLITNIILSRYVDKVYSFIDYKEKLDREERRHVFSNIKNIFVKRVSTVITNSTDNILISTMVSTIQVGFYSNYVIVYNVVRTVNQQLANGFTASIGNLSVTSDANHCIEVLKRLTFLFFAFGMVMTAGLMGAVTPFIRMWIGEEYLMANPVVYTTILVLFLEICCVPLWQFLETSGLFREDKYIGIIGSTANLIVSIVLCLKYGIVGIFIGTICSRVIQLILKTLLIFRKKYERSTLGYFFVWGKMMAGYALLVLFEYFVLRRLIIESNIAEFFIKGSISVCAAVLISVIFFIGTDELHYCRELIGKIRRRKGL